MFILGVDPGMGIIFKDKFVLIIEDITSRTIQFQFQFIRSFFRNVVSEK